jgi:GntR family transcriptional regulator/MocR family aminotransferase
VLDQHPLAGWITLVRASRVPLAEQIYRQIRDGARSGRIPTPGPLPSSRALAGALGVSRNTVTAAYELLRGEAIIDVGAGAVPMLRAQALALRTEPMSQSTEISLSARGTALAADRHALAYAGSGGAMRPGQPDVALFPRDLWARALRRATRLLDGKAMLYDHGDGLPVLRGALARYLAEARGVVVKPDQLLVVPTVQSALAMLGQALADPGETVWIEDPGYLGARAAFPGMTLDPMPVDADGADIAAMTSVPRLIYTTPSHQYPTGVRMSLARRTALLAAARRHGAIVIEDDYDSEFLWSGRPIPALHALGEAGEVVYIGTVAKSLLPGLRMAWLAVPPALAARLVEVQRNLGLLVNVHAQAAFADFIDGGQYRAHLNRISGVYQARADALAAAIIAHCGGAVTIAPPLGGLQLPIRFDPAIDDAAVAARLAVAGYSVPFLSGMSLGPPLSGLLVGFASADAAAVDRFALALAAALGLR